MEEKEENTQLIESGEQEEQGSLMLLKVPAHVFEKLSAAQNGHTIGNMEVKVEKEQGRPEKRALTFRFEDDTLDGYSVNPMSQGPPCYAFDYDHKRNKFARIGYVHDKASLVPLITENYFKAVQNRSLEETTKKNKTKALDEEELDGQMLMGQVKEVSFIAPAFALNKKRAKSGEKVDTSTLRKRVVSALGKERRMLKDLAIMCESTKGDVRDVLKEVGINVKSGRFRNFWELKSEYKDHTAEMDAE